MKLSSFRALSGSSLSRDPDSLGLRLRARPSATTKGTDVNGFRHNCRGLITAQIEVNVLEYVSNSGGKGTR